MKVIVRRFVVFCLGLGVLISAWFLINNLRSVRAVLIFAFLILIWSITKFWLPKYSKAIAIMVSKITSCRYFVLFFVLAIIFVAVSARLLFFIIYSYAPISDPGSFLSEAQSIAGGIGLVGDRYVAFFPYLAAYGNLLEVAIKLFGNSWLAVIILNTIFDLAAAGILAVLIKKLTKDGSKRYLLAFALWLLSPFNIIFSVISLPIIVVNFFIILTVFLTYLVAQKMLVGKQRALLILSIILGLVLGYGNCFRPIFLIILIALVLYFAYILLVNKFNRKLLFLSISSLLIILTIFLGIQKINVAFVSNQTGLDVPSNASGWSIYVGSSAEYAGGWNIVDDTYLYGILDNNSNLQQVHDRLASEGIERYKNLGLIGCVSLMIRKLALFAGNQSAVYDAEASIVGYQDSPIALAFSIYIRLFIFFVFIAVIRYLYLSMIVVVKGGKMNSLIIFITLALIGLFLSSMLVEVQLRYAQVMYPLFMVLMVIGFDLSKD